MFNADGMPVPGSPQAVERELLQGGGAVMADGASIHVENLNVSQKQFVVARYAEGQRPLQVVRFPSNQFDAAWQAFQEWRKR